MKRLCVYGGLTVIIFLAVLGLGIAYEGYMKDNVNHLGVGFFLYFFAYFLVMFYQSYFRIKTEIATDYMKFDWDEFRRLDLE